MALIKCPECGRTVSSSALACPNCGYDVKHRKWYMKKYGQYLIVIISLFLLFNCYMFYKNTIGLVTDIKNTEQYSVIPSKTALKIINQYENLFIFEKLFVYNFNKIKNKPIEASSDILEKYLDISINYSDYKYEEKKNILGLIFYKETVKVDLKITNNKIKSENLRFNIDLNNGYKIDNNEKFNDASIYNGTLVKEGLLNNSITIEKKEPLPNTEKIKFKNIEGVLYIK